MQTLSLPLDFFSEIAYINKVSSEDCNGGYERHYHRESVSCQSTLK